MIKDIISSLNDYNAFCTSVPWYIINFSKFAETDRTSVYYGRGMSINFIFFG